MIAAVIALAAAQAANPFEQFRDAPTFSGPAKLVLSANQGGIVAIDYPSRARCEAARASLEQQTTARINNTLRSLPQGGQLTSTPLVIGAICIPG